MAGYPYPAASGAPSFAVMPPQQSGGPVTGPSVGGLSDANALMSAGSSTAPVGSWTQGMSRIADALAGANQARQMQQPQQPWQPFGINGMGAVFAPSGSMPIAAPNMTAAQAPTLGTGNQY